VAGAAPPSASLLVTCPCLPRRRELRKEPQYFPRGAAYRASSPLILDPLSFMLRPRPPLLFWRCLSLRYELRSSSSLF